MSVHPARNLTVFAFDPSVSRQFENREIANLTLSLPWEMERLSDDLPFVGPRGEYVEVIDFDPANGVFYAPIDLNAAAVRLNDGLTPAVDNPQFHQQMVYAVAMNTIATFEMALGRVVLWAPKSWNINNNTDEKGYVQRLRIYPHALTEANAYYTPAKNALLFGYFQAGAENRQLLPGTSIFTCLSHDIITHETCHALLDGMHPYFAKPTNPDVLALHEAFADIVAILQHFSHPQVLEDQIAKTGGDLERQSLLGALAQEFGQALGRDNALRDALGEVKDGVWQPKEPDNRALENTIGAHARGSILVAAIFRGFLSIYKSRIADLLRIASQGRGVLPDGALDPDLKRRMAKEAAKSARHLLQICIRALDYCPPVDVCFGDYFRALITADFDLFPEDKHGYRAALIEAFVAWGIRPKDMSIITETTLVWPTIEEASQEANTEWKSFGVDFGVLLNSPKKLTDQLSEACKNRAPESPTLIDALDSYASEILAALGENASGAHAGSSNYDSVFSRNLLELGLTADRKIEHLVRRFYAELFWGMINDPVHKNIHDLIGLDLSDDAPLSIKRSKYTKNPALQVHSVRMANRIGDRGQTEREYVVEIVQSRAGYFDLEEQARADKGLSKQRRDFVVRSGTTLLIDARSLKIRRIIRTDGKVSDPQVLARHRAFHRQNGSRPSNAFDGLPDTRQNRNPFAALHRNFEKEAGA